MIDTLLSQLAPHLCCNCGKIGTLLCDGCKYDIVNDDYGRCVACERPAADHLCNAHTDVAAGWYVAERAGPLERLIDQYKFENARAAYRPLAELLLMRLPQLPAATVIVPIPTIPTHIRQRGYDHMALIARRFARERGYSYAPLLLRVTQTKQRGASRTLRLRQAAGAFGVRSKLDPTVPYVVIDDVATTGATLLAAAKVLRAAGAQTVYVAAIARQPLD